MAWLSGFTKRLKITIPSDNVDSTLTDFPILLKLSTDCGLTGFDASLVFDELELDANRFKIAVTASDGTTQRYVEIEKWDDSSEIAWLWVKVPSVAASGKTELYFYYDSTATPNTAYVGDVATPAGSQVWTNGFYQVYHLSDTSGPLLDSTTTSGTAVLAGSYALATPAKVAEGVDWTGQGAAVDYFGEFSPSQVTVESWIKEGSVDGAIHRWVSCAGSSGDMAVIRQDSGTAEFHFYIQTASTLRHIRVSSSIDTNWAYWAGTWDGTTQRAYKDGSQIGTPNVPGGSLEPIANISISSNSGEYFTGLQDEVRLSTTGRSASWIKATYYTSDDNFLYMEEDVTSPEWLGTWDQRIKITIDKDKVDENIVDFPVLVTLASGVGLTGADTTPVFDELDYAFTPNDTFSGTDTDPPDPTKWLDGGGGGAGQIQSNKLRLSVGSGSTQSKNYYGTYKLQGDFDVQVDYDIILGPSTQNWFFSLSISTDEPSWTNKNRANLYRQYSGAHRFEWQTYDVSYHTEANPTNSATSGKLRITRVGSTWTAYYDVGGGWVSLGASAFLNKTGPVIIRIRLENYTPNEPAVTFDLDNFIVNNGTVIWGNNESYVSNFPNSKKFAITTADGISQCYAEIDMWDQYNEQAFIWTKVPIISSTEDTVLYLYYDSAQADNTTYVGDLTETAARNVWDSNFVMVHHMGKWPTLNQVDSTANATNTTASNNFEDTDQVDGLIAKAISGDGVDESFDLPTTGILEVSPYTLEVILQKDTQGSSTSVLCYTPKDAHATGRGWLIKVNSSGVPYSVKGSGDGSWEGVTATTVTTNGEYHYIAVRFEADTLYDILINGVIEDSETDPGELADVTYADGGGTNPPTKVARIFSEVVAGPTEQGFMDGKIDEIRVSGAVRSTSWVKATNDTARDNLISYGAPEPEPAPSVGTFNGYVELAGQSVARIVALYRRSTGELQDYTTSNPNTGYFELETPYDELHYLVILPDISDGYQPITRDQIDPV